MMKAAATQVEPLATQTALPACDFCLANASGVYAPAYCASDERIANARVDASSVRANAVIMRAGETQTQVHTLRRGWAMQVAYLSDGRRQILHFFIPGDLLGVEALLFGDRPTGAAIRALTDVEICTFPADTIRGLLDATPTHRERFLDHACCYMSGMTRLLADIGQRSAQGRIAQILLELWERLKARGLAAGDSFEMPVRQEHLADALGMTSVHVNRTLGTLRAAGIIDFDRKTMHILDGARLRAIAEEE